MKIDSTLPNRVFAFIPKETPIVTPQVMMSKKIITQPKKNNVAENKFENWAMDMEPQDYIKMRTYLSDIEMQQLYNSDIF